MSTVQGQQQVRVHPSAADQDVVDMISPMTPEGGIRRWMQDRFGSPAERRARQAAELGLIG